MANQDQIKVSVCVVTYNQERFIEQCLQSILDQVVDFKFEVLVSDDLSTDKTREIISEFQKNNPEVIKPIFHKSNIGAFGNFIQVHNMARGEYICHVDGDDYWLPGKLKYQVEFLDNNKDFVQMWTFAKLVDDDDVVKGLFPSKKARHLYPSLVRSEDIASSYALVGHHSTQIYRRSARSKFLIPAKNLLDYWFAFNYSVSGKSYYSKKVLSAYRITSSDSLTRSKSPSRITVDVFSDNILDLIHRHPKYRREFKSNLLVRYFFSRISGHNLSCIKSNLNSVKGVDFSFFSLVKSFFYFLVQKL
jgi:glycosyltransferase involved in cell wall biosynthesis